MLPQARVGLPRQRTGATQMLAFALIECPTSFYSLLRTPLRKSRSLSTRASDAIVTAPHNVVGVQLLERKLHKQLFPPNTGNAPPVDNVALDICRDHLARNELHASKASQLTPTTFTLPPLQGRDLDEHFWSIGRRSAQPWLEFANSFAAQRVPAPPVEAVENMDESTCWSASSWLALDNSLRSGVPLRSVVFLRQPGWTKYSFLRTAEGEIAGLSDGVAVPYPDVEDTALVFDTEVMVAESPYPVLAAAVGFNAWYTWVSPWLAQAGERHESKAHLIPMGPRDGSAPPRLIIGHNAGFDRAMVLDEYTLHGTSIRWLDTMSLHVATSGISSPQRAEWTQRARERAERRLHKLLAAERAEDETRTLIRSLFDGADVDASALAGLNDTLRESVQENIDLLASFGMPSLDEDAGTVLWHDITSCNSLADVAALHCGIHMDKSTRNMFVDGTPRETIWENCPSLLAYCAADVTTTYAVFRKVWPAFLTNCPHPATVAGVLGLGSTFLPVDAHWPAYIARASAKFDEMNARVISTLRELAHSLKDAGVAAINAGIKDRWWETDPWYSQLDWTPKQPKSRTADTVYVPAWWRELRGKRLSSRHKIATHLLRLHLDGVAVIPGKHTRWALADGRDLTNAPLSQATLQRFCVTSKAGPLGEEALEAIHAGDANAVNQVLHRLADATRDQGPGQDACLNVLDWTSAPLRAAPTPGTWWPQWFWELYSATTGEVEVTIRAKIAPLLLKIAWDNQPVFRSREHGWVYRGDAGTPHSVPLTFSHEADAGLRDGCTYYKLPHTNGDGANVGNPFSKGFLPFFEIGRLQSKYPSESGGAAARAALDMNAMCSYWISARDRIEKQMVVFDGEAGTSMGLGDGEAASASNADETSSSSHPRGLILPQVVTMGTVTRRAIERTWLTASNAKAKRIGSELKSMVRAPPGWSIVGADVDSEELWICSVMGDAQFGIHGATAIGWMTLEGSKAQGTDLHSKTAGILGTSRNEAKVFNYSRIYGAGIRHAMQLLRKADPDMALDEAARRSKLLYAATKGRTTNSSALFRRRFWYGGSESFVFNKLEEIATSDNPRTPALDCGITAALSKKFLPSDPRKQDYMPSRINWVVQSSGVDYLHLLITAMEHLCSTYQIDARFMLSVHDEVRYLARETDRYRAALALQIANLWTRSMFAHKLNMDDLPESCAFFAAVDIDHVLRKEVDDPCVTPSQPEPIPPGECLTMRDILAKTRGSLFHDQRPMPEWQINASNSHPMTSTKYDNDPPYVSSPQQHRCIGEAGLLFLQAQASTDLDEIRALDRRWRSLQGGQSMSRRSHTQYPSRRAGTDSTHPLRTRSTSQNVPSRPLSTSAVRRNRPRGLGVLTAIEAMLPPRPIRERRAVWERLGYRAHMRSLYRRLLRAVRRTSHRDVLTALVRRRMRRWQRKSRRSNAYAYDLSDKLRGLAASLEQCIACAAPPLSAKLVFEQLVTEATQETPKQRKQRLLPSPHLHVSGALLPPSLYNAPMLRYKPEQPLRMTMMIRDRRRARIRRVQRWDEVQEMKHLAEVEAEAAPTPFFDNASSWRAHYLPTEMYMQAQFRRERERARMTFSEEMLRRAKAGRRAKHAYFTRKAQKARAARDVAENKASS